MLRILAVIILALALAGCGGRQAQQPAQPAPSQPEAGQPSQPEAGQPSQPEQPAAESPAPAAPPGEGIVVYPGAREKSRSTFSGAGPSGGSGNWTTASFETTDPYEKVRDFYKANAPKGWQQSLVNENSEEDGRTFAMWMSRSDNKAWFTVTVSEKKSEGKVEVVTAYGVTK